MNARTQPINDELIHRICSEFSEMPGLQLTSRQAQRLWGLDADTCEKALTVLIETGFLRRVAPDKYARTTEGVVELPRLRMAKASIAAPSEERKKGRTGH